MAINKLTGKGYSGQFTIEIYPDVSVDFLKQGNINFAKNGNLIEISNGSARQSVGDIQMYSEEKSFHFGYPNIKKITSSAGEILWQNWNEDKK